MSNLVRNKGYRFGVWLRRLWWKVKYFFNGEARQDRRERKAWAALSKKALRKRLAEFTREEREERRAKLADRVAIAVKHGYLEEDRPYKDCMTAEHFDVIMRSRVVELKVDGRTLYEVNTKGMEEWEVEEFWHMLKNKSRLHRPHPIIREVISDRFPQ